jgi:hypothetical protein
VQASDNREGQNDHDEPLLHSDENIKNDNKSNQRSNADEPSLLKNEVNSNCSNQGRQGDVDGPIMSDEMSPNENDVEMQGIDVEPMQLSNCNTVRRDNVDEILQLIHQVISSDGNLDKTGDADEPMQLSVSNTVEQNDVDEPMQMSDEVTSSDGNLDRRGDADEPMQLSVSNTVEQKDADEPMQLSDEVIISDSNLDKRGVADEPMQLSVSNTVEQNDADQPKQLNDEVISFDSNSGKRGDADEPIQLRAELVRKDNEGSQGDVDELTKLTDEMNSNYKNQDRGCYAKCVSIKLRDVRKIVTDDEIERIGIYANKLTHLGAGVNTNDSHKKDSSIENHSEVVHSDCTLGCPTSSHEINFLKKITGPSSRKFPNCQVITPVKY